MKEHWRVLSTLKNGNKVIQRPHFASENDARLWLKSVSSIILPDETAEIIKDFDDRSYPIWRANKP